MREPGATDATSTSAADAAIRSRTPLVPLPPETWDGAVESRSFLTGQGMPLATDGRHDLRPIGVALGLVGVVGITALVAVMLNAGRRSASQVPVSILRHGPANAGRRGEAG